jgi:P22 coat protein - gene protein 5
MANAILTPSMIAKKALMAFKNKLAFTAGIDRQYSKEFAQSGAKIGNTITVRKPARFTVRTGPAIQVQDVTEESMALVLSNQKGVDSLFSTADLTLTIDDFYDRYIKNQIIALANQVDVDGCTMAAQKTFNAVGTSGTPPSAMLLYLQAQQKLNEMSCPSDDQRSILINPAAQPATINALSGLFQSSTLIAQQYEKGMMGKGLGADWYMTQNIYASTTGTGGTSSPTTLTTGNPQTGATLSVVSWGSTSTSVIGDVFTIAGVYKVNPITKQSTGVLQQFVVTANATASGGAITNLGISPSIIVSGPTQTVSAAPATTAAITMVTAANTLTANNILMHKNAFTLGTADMEMPDGVHFAARATDPESGLSIRIVRQYDINSDTIPCRLDILYGLAAPRPEWACRILG